MGETVLLLERATLLGEDGMPILREAEARLHRGAKAHLAGTGRTCLLRACAGLMAPSAGRILMEDIPLGPLAFQHPLIRRGGLGWVPTAGGLLVNQPLRANVALPLRFTRKLGKAAADAEADRWLAALGLLERGHLRPHALDPTDRWLGALARAAALIPDLWLVDRPPSALDPAEAQRAAAVLQEAEGAMLTAFGVAGLDGPRWTLSEGRLSVEEPHAT